MKTKKLVHKIEKHYAYHGAHIKLQVLSVENNGDRLVFRVCLKPGTKASLIFERASDIQMALQMQLFQPFRDGLNLCLAVSRNNATQNSLMKMLRSRMFCQSRNWLPIAIGYSVRQEMIFADLAEMPHVMYAGSTNSGKSVGLVCLICSLIIKQPVWNVNLLIFDVGANTLGVFNNIPHLSYPIIKDHVTGIYVVRRLIEEMERRIDLNDDELRMLPAIVCVIDEYVSFINNIDDKKLSADIASKISNIIRRGRHAKIHLVISTQDPALKNMKVDVGNITTRLAFKCAKYHNSIAILGESGAEKLQGKGTLLFKSDNYPDPIYLQGAYISDDEAAELVNYVKAKEYDFSNKFLILELNTSEVEAQVCEDVEKICDKDEELAKIIIWILARDKISASQIMAHFTMGNRAYDIVEQLYGMGLVAEKFSNQPRKVLPQSFQDVPNKVRALLQNCGYSEDMVAEVIRSRESFKDYETYVFNQ